MDGDGYLDDVDCDDANPNVHPDAEDYCDSTDWNCDGQDYQSGTVTSYEPSGRVNINDLFNIEGDGSAHSDVILDDIFTGTIKEVHICDLTLHNTLVVGEDTTLVGHGEAVIDPLEEGRGIHINGLNTTIEGVTVTNGTQVKGGGIYCDAEIDNPEAWNQSANQLHLLNVTARGNSADDGGGLFVEALCPVVITDSTLEDNEAINGGGGYLKSNTIINGLVVNNNTAASSMGYGGGLHFGGERKSTENSNPPYNAMTFQSIAAIVSDLSVTNNRALFGGGIFLNNTDLRATGAAISGNVSSQSGGGMLSVNSISRFEASSFSSNTATFYGGAILLSTPVLNNGGNYLINRMVCAEGTQIDRNTATTQSAAIDIESGSQLRAEGCDFGTGADANSADIFTLGSGQTHSYPSSWWGFCDNLSCGDIEDCTDGIDNLGNGLVDYNDPTCSPTSSTMSVLELTTDWFDHTQLIPDGTFTYIDEGNDVLKRIDASQTSCVQVYYANAFSSFVGLFDSGLNLVEGKEYLGVLGSDAYTISPGVHFVGFSPPDSMRTSSTFIFDVTVTAGACN